MPGYLPDIPDDEWLTYQADLFRRDSTERLNELARLAAQQDADAFGAEVAETLARLRAQPSERAPVPSDRRGLNPVQQFAQEADRRLRKLFGGFGDAVGRAGEAAGRFAGAIPDAYDTMVDEARAGRLGEVVPAADQMPLPSRVLSALPTREEIRQWATEDLPHGVGTLARAGTAVTLVPSAAVSPNAKALQEQIAPSWEEIGEALGAIAPAVDPAGEAVEKGLTAAGAPWPVAFGASLFAPGLPVGKVARLNRARRLAAPSWDEALDLGRQLVRLAQEGGGFTFDVVNRQVRPIGEPGIAVAWSKETENWLSGALRDPEQAAKETASYLLQHWRDIAENPANHLGGWVPKGTHDLVLDLPRVTPSLDEAAKIGRAANQETVFDLQRNRTVALPPAEGVLKAEPLPRGTRVIKETWSEQAVPFDESPILRALREASQRNASVEDIRRIPGAPGSGSEEGQLAADWLEKLVYPNKSKRNLPVVRGQSYFDLLENAIRPYLEDGRWYANLGRMARQSMTRTTEQGSVLDPRLANEFAYLVDLTSSAQAPTPNVAAALTVMMARADFMHALDDLRRRFPNEMRELGVTTTRPPNRDELYTLLVNGRLSVNGNLIDDASVPAWWDVSRWYRPSLRSVAEASGRGLPVPAGRTGRGLFGQVSPYWQPHGPGGLASIANAYTRTGAATSLGAKTPAFGYAVLAAIFGSPTAWIVPDRHFYRSVGYLKDGAAMRNRDAQQFAHALGIVLGERMGENPLVVQAALWQFGKEYLAGGKRGIRPAQNALEKLTSKLTSSWRDMLPAGDDAIVREGSAADMAASNADLWDAFAADVQRGWITGLDTIGHGRHEFYGSTKLNAPIQITGGRFLAHAEAVRAHATLADVVLTPEIERRLGLEVVQIEPGGQVLERFRALDPVPHDIVRHPGRDVVYVILDETAPNAVSAALQRLADLTDTTITSIRQARGDTPVLLVGGKNGAPLDARVLDLLDAQGFTTIHFPGDTQVAVLDWEHDLDTLWDRITRALTQEDLDGAVEFKEATLDARRTAPAAAEAPDSLGRGALWGAGEPEQGLGADAGAQASAAGAAGRSGIASRAGDLWGAYEFSPVQSARGVTGAAAGAGAAYATTPEDATPGERWKRTASGAFLGAAAAGSIGAPGFASTVLGARAGAKARGVAAAPVMQTAATSSLGAVRGLRRLPKRLTLLDQTGKLLPAADIAAQLKTARPALPAVRAAVNDDPAWVQALARANHLVGTYARMSLLTGPLTHARNVLGNSGALLWTPLERAVAAPLEPLAARLTEGKREARYAGEAVSILEGYFAALPAALANLRAVYGTTEGLQKASPFTALNAADTFFHTLAEGGQLFALAYRKAKTEGLTGTALRQRAMQIAATAPAEMIEAAAQAGDYMTYRAALGRFERGLQAAIENSPALTVVQPFFTTPLNVIKHDLERSPLGVVGVAKGIAAKETSGQVADRMARTLIGSAIAATFYKYALDGNITGAYPDNAKEYEAWRQQGKIPFAIKLGETWYSYALIPGVASSLALAAEMARAEQTDKSTVMGAVTAIARVMAEKQFMDNLATLVEVIINPEQTEHILSTLGGNLARTLVPAGGLLGQVERATSDVQRAPRTVEERVKAGIPGLSEQVPARVDVFGQPVTRPVSGVAALVNPVAVSPSKTNVLTAEFERLSTVLKRPIHPTLPPTIDMETARVRGQLLSDALYRLILSPKYLLAEPEEQARMLATVSGQATRQARDVRGGTR